MKQHHKLDYNKLRDYVISRAKAFDGNKLLGGEPHPGVMGFYSLRKTKKIDLDQLSLDIISAGYIPATLVVAPEVGSRGRFILHYVITYKDQETHEE